MTTSMRPSPLRARRLLRGWRLRDLARQTGIHDMTLSLLERAELPLRGRWVTELARIYHTPVETLRGEMARWVAETQPDRAVGSSPCGPRP
jgi:transcriptional regulator with XRE-family HTH domain